MYSIVKNDIMCGNILLRSQVYTLCIESHLDKLVKSPHSINILFLLNLPFSNPCHTTRDTANHKRLEAETESKNKLDYFQVHSKFK